MNKEFEKHVKILKKNGSDILKEIKESEVQVLTNILDTMVHHGDQLDASKKQVFYNKPLEYNPLIYTKPRASKYFKELTDEKCDLLHMTVGVVGESTELAHAVLNHIGHLETLDIENIKEELGDILFYVQGVADSLNLDLKDIMKENIEKLKKRYPKGYSDESAQERKDKIEFKTSSEMKENNGW